MSKAFNRIIDTTLKVIEPRPRGYYAPLVPPPQSSDFTFNEQEMVIK